MSTFYAIAVPIVGVGLAVINVALLVVLIRRGHTNRALRNANRQLAKALASVPGRDWPARSVHRSPITPAELREESAVRLRLTSREY